MRRPTRAKWKIQSGCLEWIRAINLPVQSRALSLFELQGNTIRQPDLHRSLADTSGVRRYQRFGGVCEMVGHLGAAPSVSPIRTARIAVFLVPDEMVEPRGIAPRSAPCRSAVLLLNDGPEVDARPGLAPGNSVLQTDGSTTLPCARCDGVTAGIRTRIFWFTARNSDS